MTNGKYIVFDEQSILIFDPVQEHATVAGSRRDRVTSAGFIEVGIGLHSNKITVSCYGKSTSLGIEPMPVIDEALARFALGLN